MLCVNILDGLLQKVTVYFVLAQLKLLAKARYSLAKFKGEEIVILSQVSYTFFENPCLNEFFYSYLLEENTIIALFRSAIFARSPVSFGPI